MLSALLPGLPGIAPTPASLPSSFSSSHIPLDELFLSNRSYNALRRNGITSVEQLAAMSDQEIWNLRNIGAKSFAEIKDRLQAYLAKHPLQLDLTPSEDEHKQLPVTEPKPRLVRRSRASLAVLGLSRRPYNALMRHGVTTVEQLIVMTDQDILAVQNVGVQSLTEIKDKLRAYSTEHPPLFASIHPMEESSILSPPSLLADPEMLDSVREKGVPLDEISVDRLALPKSLGGLLRGANVETVGDLARQPRDKWEQQEEIVQRLNRYLMWLVEQGELVWANEVAGRGISPLHRLELAEMSLEALCEKWFSPLKNKERQIIHWRYGLDGERLTLGEIGERIGLTRERVRQIQNRAMDVLSTPRSLSVLQPFETLLVYLLEQAGGLLNEAQFEVALRRELVIGDVNPVGMAHLVFQFSDDVRWLRETKAWGLEDYPLNEVERVQKELIQVLRKAHVPLPVDEVVTRFKAGRYYRDQQDALKGSSFIMACLRVHPDVLISEDNSCGLKKWERSNIDEIILALREIGEPAHYEEIAEKTNELLALEMRTSAHNIHAVLGRRTDLFVRVGNGVFGLKEWGLPDDGNLANAAYRVLSEAGKPLHIEIIADRVLETWRARRSSVYVAVDLDDRFVNVGRGVYWLRERIAEGGEVEGEADFGDLFGKRLGRWQVELGLRDNGVNYDTHSEADAIRQTGLDFFE